MKTSTDLQTLYLKKREEQRLKSQHVWIYSNEVDVAKSPLRNFTAGEQVLIASFTGELLGKAYVNPQSLICARLFSRDPSAELDCEFFKTKIQQALVLRERLFAEPYYRLVFGESDGLPGVVIDRFGPHFAIQINTQGMENVKEILLAALVEVCAPQSVLWKNDSGSRDFEKLPKIVEAAFGEPPKEVELIENGVKFKAPFWEGQKTGWFYDHRMNRLRLKDYVKGQYVLDVFSYLGGWGLEAMGFGAKSLTAIDSSAKACEYIQSNAKLNNFEKVEVICNDAFEALKALMQQGQKFDVVIVDPPAFIKRQKDLKEGSMAYQRINEMAIKLLNPNGILVSASCSMHLHDEDFVSMLHKAAVKSYTELQLLELGHQGPDHPIHLAIPETRYIKSAILRKI
ncbi:MAG: class I SAM-dependent rRNA methyltransferase [Gammaproteobacteria bacterium]|nr:class I SAM-dependent rRNA methyltransferase [Gammaproteobacteria bacterium]